MARYYPTKLALGFGTAICLTAVGMAALSIERGELYGAHRPSRDRKEAANPHHYPSRDRQGVVDHRPLPDGRGSESNAIPAKPSSGFRDIAREAGLNFRMNFLPNEQGEKFKINLYDHGCGVAVGDFDGDGHDDIYFVNQLGPNALYRNKGDGTFEDVTEKAGVGLGDRVCVAATFADYDNYGRQSLFVTSTRGGNVLFQNIGDGTFKDVTKQAGVGYVGHSQTAVFFDYDNDGYLDLFVTNTAKWTADQATTGEASYYPGRVRVRPRWLGSPNEHNILYHNNGDGTFTDVTAKAGLAGKGWGGDVAVFDYDGDGYLDLLVTNMFGASQLYRNNGDGTFTDVTKEVLGRTSWGAIGSQGVRFQQRRPARPAHRGHALRHVAAADAGCRHASDRPTRIRPQEVPARRPGR